MKVSQKVMQRIPESQRMVALFLLPAAFLSTCLRAQQCTTKTTQGRYMVTCDGYLRPGPTAPLIPARTLGIATADAEGNFAGGPGGGGAFSLGGQILQQSVKGTEQIEPDCTGTITYQQTINGQPVPDLHIAFIVSERGNRIDGIATDPGNVYSCVLRRLDSKAEETRSQATAGASPRPLPKGSKSRLLPAKVYPSSRGLQALPSFRKN